MRLFKVADRPALILSGRRRTLVVADIHVGIGGYADSSLVNAIVELYEMCRADELVIAGDFKHSISPRWREVELFSRLAKEVNLTLVKGNHDGGLKGVRELEVGKVCIIHGHLKPLSEAKVLVMGHAHPAVLIRHGAGGIKERVWLEGKVDGRDVIVMPAFNDVCASTAVNVERPPGILKDVKNFSATMLDGTFLGEVGSI